MAVGMRDIAAKIWRKVKRDGVAATWRAILTRIGGHPSSLATNLIVDRFEDLIFAGKWGTADGTAAEQNTILWLIPDFGAQSGGHINLARMATLLEQQGYTSKILVLPPHRWSRRADAEAAFRRAFSNDRVEVFIDTDEGGKNEFLFATSWQTAYYLSNYADNQAVKLYFVQDYEPHFYPVGCEYFLAQATYKFGFSGVTAG